MAREVSIHAINDNLVSGTGSAVISFPFTVSFYHYTTATNSTRVFVSFCDSASATNRNSLYMSSGSLIIYLNETADSTGISVATNAWERITLSASQPVLTDLVLRVGSSTYSNSTFQQIGSHDRWSAGVNCDSSPSSPLGSGNYMAEVAIWNAAFTAAQQADLHNSNVSPLLYRPQSLRHYCPLIQDADETDWVGGRHLVETGTAAVYSSHPSVIRRPRMFRTGFTTSGAAPAAEPYLPYHGWRNQMESTLLRM